MDMSEKEHMVTHEENQPEVETTVTAETGAAEEEVQPLEEMKAEIPTFQEGDILYGRVVLVQDDAEYVDILGKSDVPVALNELSLEEVSFAHDEVKERDTIKVMVIEIDEDKIILSRRRAEDKLVWERLKSAFHEKDV